MNTLFKKFRYKIVRYVGKALGIEFIPDITASGSLLREITKSGKLENTLTFGGNVEIITKRGKINNG